MAQINLIYVLYKYRKKPTSYFSVTNLSVMKPSVFCPAIMFSTSGDVSNETHEEAQS